MVVMYNVLGKQVGSHWLAMATLGGTAAIAFLSTSGGSKDKATPPIQASSGDEEKFIREFIAKAEAEEKATAKH